MEDAYAKSVAEVLEAFGVDRTKGLTDSQVEQHARLYGKNVLPQEESTPFWKLVLKQFDDLLVKILIAAAVISFLLARMNGETGLSAFLEPSVIFMILAANAAVGVITETNAEKALEELRAYQADIATVLRNGSTLLPWILAFHFFYLLSGNRNLIGISPGANYHSCSMSAIKTKFL